MIISASENKYRAFFLLILALQTLFANASTAGQSTAGGEIRRTLAEAYPLEIAGISFTTFLLVLYILKERKHKKELNKIRSELTLALDAGYMAVWRYNVGNKTFRRLHRNTVPHDGMSKNDMAKQIHPDDKEKYEEFLGSLSSGKDRQKNYIFRLDLDGRDEWHDVYAIGIPDSSGNISHIIGTERDITAETIRKQEYDKNKQMLDFILKAVRIMPWEYDVASKTFNINEEFNKQFNISRNTITLDELLLYTHPDDAQRLVQGLSNLTEGITRMMSIQIRTKDPKKQEYQWFEMQGVTYRRHEDGRVRSIIGLKHDISERKQHEEQIRLREKAEQSNRLKSTFLANMSHEIRTPLNAIVGFSTLIAETDDKEERQEFSRIIQANNDMLLHLINDILDMSKIEAGQMDFHFSNVDLREMIQNLAYTFRFKLKEGVTISLEMSPEPYILCTEKNRLTQVLSNFISNACKYTTEGSITIGYEVEGKQVYFFVRDTGKGIARENLPHVFERFAKFDAFVQGTGLGLSICELIVQNLGGKIGVESEPGEGSTFWCTLPVTHPVAE